VIRRALAAAVGIALAAAASAGASPAHAAQLQLDGSTNYDSASSSTTSTTQALSTGLGPTASGASLRLISQTDWVTGTGSSATFNIEVVPTLGPSNEAADVEVDVLVYDMLGSRSALTNSLAADGLHEGYVLAHPISANLGRFTVGPGGAITIRIPVGGRYGQLHLDRSGVYPVAVELRPLGGYCGESGRGPARMANHTSHVPRWRLRSDRNSVLERLAQRGRAEQTDVLLRVHRNQWQHSRNLPILQARSRGGQPQVGGHSEHGTGSAAGPAVDVLGTRRHRRLAAVSKPPLPLVTAQ